MNLIKTTALLVASLSMSLASDAHATDAPLTMAFSSEMPPIASSFERWDICQEVDDLIDSLGFASSLLPRLCNQEMTQSFSVGVASVTLAGTLTELVVEDGNVNVDGPVDIQVDFTPLRIAGGRAPTFAPCDRADFDGCLKPTLSTFANFLATFVPALDVNLPVPVRVCAPGTPIVVKKASLSPGRWIPGYWVGWSYVLPRYIPGTFTPPVVELCRITDFGELPQVTMPQVQEVFIDVYPHVTADMGLSVAGDGSIDIEIPVPYAGAKFGYANRWLDLDLTAGVSLVLSVDVSNSGADAFLSFDEEVHIRSHFIRGQGWTQHAEILKNTVAPSLTPHTPDVTIRAGVKLGLEATAMASIGSDSAEAEPADAADAEDETAVWSDEGSDDPSSDEGSSDEGSESEEFELPPLPVEEPVQCAAQWLADGASLELGFETKAELVMFVEGIYQAEGTEPAGFAIEAGAEFSHAESLSAPGLCSIECATLAGEDNPACGTIELFRLPIASF